MIRHYSKSIIMDSSYIENFKTVFDKYNLSKELENTFEIECGDDDILTVITLVAFGMSDNSVLNGFRTACKKDNKQVIE